MEQKRDLNLDLIRCTALLMVPTMHGLDHVDIYSVTLQTPGDLVMMTVKILFTCCIPLWIMLTGWLCRGRRFERRYYLGYLRIYTVYLLCSILCLVFDRFVMREEIGLRRAFGAIVNFYSCDYAWYIMMYTGLFLMMPFLNLMYNSLQTRGQKRVLVLTFMALSVLPSLLNTYVQLWSVWWKTLYPVCYYFTGAYLAEFLPRRRPGRLFAALVLCLAGYACFFFFHAHASGAALIGVYQDDFGVYVLSVLLFSALASLRLDGLGTGVRRFLVRISELSLAMYLLTWLPDRFCYRILMARVPEIRCRYIWLAPIVCVSLITAGALAVPVTALASRLSGVLRTKLEAAFAKGGARP